MPHYYGAQDEFYLLLIGEPACTGRSLTAYQLVVTLNKLDHVPVLADLDTSSFVNPGNRPFCSQVKHGSPASRGAAVWLTDTELQGLDLARWRWREYLCR